MPEVAQRHIVIAENIPAWQQNIARLIKLLAPDAKLHFAIDSVEALQIIDDIRSEAGHCLSLVLTDLHMSANGEANGDDLIAGLMSRQEDMPPIALVSGTLADPERHDLASRTGITTLEKDAFSPTADDFEEVRRPLMYKLSLLLAGQIPALDKDPNKIAALKLTKKQLAKVATSRVLSDEVKGRLGQICGKHAEFLANIESAEILQAPDLYDETGIKLHEFKNQLKNLIEDIASRDGHPSILITELASLQVYINRFLSSRLETVDEADIVSLTEGICNNFRVFPGIRDRLEIKLPKDPIVLKVDQTKFQQILIEMIQNALTHSTDPIQISIDTKQKEVLIMNFAKEDFDIDVLNNELVAGELEGSGSASGSGQGLKFVMQTSRNLGLKYNLEKIDGVVYSSIAWEPIHEGGDDRIEVIQDTTDETVAENPPELPNVVFICHDGSPKGTFKDLLSKKVPGYRYIVADTNRYNLEDFALQRPELFNNAALVVVHMDASEYEKLLGPLCRLFPHLIFLPASMMPSSLRIEEMRKSHKLLLDRSRMSPYTDKGIENILNRDDIFAHFEADEGKLNRIANGLYFKDYEQEEWQILLAIAQKLALKRKQQGV